ncbi:DUF5789 family protein [Halococcus thailandensis]|uniref:DUF2795 domain-containing protein n=1 Tax=Halococcus thailandensis JCM 13552 TaxID=1227457 RepID=M0N7P9_9EURY|nr:hypothetical protein [Halococcus thailandensis]EMA53896.1 hypothetical protein C451_08661 [Halococcus thailandensis JCM 13552]
MTDEDDTRQHGVEFGEFGDRMESFDYPLDHETLVDEHGDAEIGLPDGETRLDELLAPLQDDEQTYQDPAELETMILNLVGDDAIGRENYSDRGPSTATDGDDEESL